MPYRTRFVAGILLLAALSGCGSQVAMHDPRIPDPLIAQMPLAVGVRYPEKFEHFVHEERVIGKEEWKIDLGKSNKLLFTKLFSSMFADVTVVGPDADAATLGLDAVIEPDIDAFEFSVPEQSQTDAFAVWIRYRIRIFDDAGTQIANWPISAYGKSQSSTFGGDDALRRAAILAMRDAAALVILQMDKATGISKLANSANGAVDADLNAGAPDTGPASLQTTAAEEIPDETG
ncbi:MAG: hypothetical protein U5K76_05975 [Woeseiaceae bacterium]|nr:hypothetical protein [Woeseiaceae bacterium]